MLIYNESVFILILSKLNISAYERSMYSVSLQRRAAMVKSVVGERSNRRRTRWERPFPTWFAVRSDDTDSDLRYIGRLLYGSISEALNDVVELDPEVDPVYIRV